MAMPWPISRSYRDSSGSSPSTGGPGVACWRGLCAVICPAHASGWSAGGLAVRLSAGLCMLAVDVAGRPGCGRYCLGSGQAEFFGPALDVRPEPVVLVQVFFAGDRSSRPRCDRPACRFWGRRPVQRRTGCPVAVPLVAVRWASRPGGQLPGPRPGDACDRSRRRLARGGIAGLCRDEWHPGCALRPAGRSGPGSGCADPGRPGRSGLARRAGGRPPRARVSGHAVCT